MNPQYKTKVHGHQGPVQASYSPYFSPQFKGVFDGLRELGVNEMKDPNGGRPFGVAWCPSSIDPDFQTRSSSETAYLAPILERKNLLVITEALVRKINWAKGKEGDGLLVAKGVEFANALTGKIHKAVSCNGGPLELHILGRADIDCPLSSMRRAR